ncbi:hypothetical protein OOK41_05285 [Micromonospora sp. NBC_01655]|uniref:hypothetical protein n=1 Tax=Micromonospora sp. NBC_01655 TaxID=2975983 RepID=UPI00224C8145|nr:hypothetical protein [Micromonospora sp. NBC_01655]MCX4469716.1 hypothetical protein [Micromonospora sp. NBC_01655]
MRPTHLRAALIVALLAAVGGCAAGAPGPPTPAGPPSSAGTATTGPNTGADPTAATAPVEASPGTRVVLHRSGGIAGRDDTVTVEPDGRWTAVDRAGARRTGRLTGANLDRLRRLTAEPRLTEGGSTDSEGHCSDTYEYRLTVGTGTVDWTDCPVAGEPPQAASALAEIVFTAIS